MITCFEARLGQRALLASIGFLLLCESAVHAGGTVTNANEAELRAALQGGGLVRLAFDGQLVLSNTVVIALPTVLDGSGHTVTLSGGGRVRLLQIPAGVNLGLTNLTLANGLSTNGGAIFNSGILSIVQVTFEDNAVLGGKGLNDYRIPGDAFGGALCNFGFLTLTNTTLSGNCSTGGSISGAIFGQGATAWGGGVFNQSGTTIVQSVTFASNLVVAGASSPRSPPAGANGFNIANNAGRIELCDSILAGGNNTTNCYGPLIDQGHNLSTDASGAFTATGSLQWTDPKLLPLADNGGPTRTMALQPDSPAIDHGVAVAGVTTDQRGMARPSGSAPDIGAFEFVSTPPVTGSLLVRLGQTLAVAGGDGCISLSLESSIGLTNLSFTLRMPEGRFTNLTLTALAPEIASATISPLSPTLATVNLAAQPGQVLLGPKQYAQICFALLPDQSSAFVSIEVTDPVGLAENGTPIGNSSGSAGRTIVIGEQPLLESVSTSAKEPVLLLYGQPGWTCIIEQAASLTPGSSWQATTSVAVTNLTTTIPLTPTGTAAFFRALRQLP